MPKHTHPNPTPALHSHPSSRRSLCDYIDNEVVNFRYHYNDDDMEYYRDEHEHSHTCCPVHRANGSVTRASSSTSSPKPTTQLTPSDIAKCTVAGSFLSSYPTTPLSPTEREEIEAFIPATILKLPTMFRPRALHAWLEYAHLQGEIGWRGMSRKKKKKKGNKSNVEVMPWDKGVGGWSGSFPSDAMEVVKIGGWEDGSGGKGVYVHVPSHREEGKRKASTEGKQEEGEGYLDMNDGHVLARDWACGKEGTVKLVYEGKEGDENADAGKQRKGSLFHKMVHVLKRVFS
ncbi:hypothetical protein P171DRAFT_435069 [Karstenula rhodostoma CBS 690.94]|uniref:Uncharacterized protein n=1 Tax=Karstenula rhodostoma CBS 690.94 TaxID=1392251 RepID=A0A9P4PA56_9PLEO|nr:hypothetical protein P171DRAFT_435069 [Karstenula rhodostoma CBS 690.94]